MKRSILRLIATFAVFTVIFVLLKPLFMLFYSGGVGAADWFAVMGHGLAMDLSMAAYMTVIPALLITASQWWSYSAGLGVAFKIYRLFASGIIALVTVVDLVLYGYWGFRIDVTPIFYFTTSPSAAMASASISEILLGLIGVILLWSFLYYLLKFTAGRIRLQPGGDVKRTVVMVILSASLFLPLRGGVTVSTMNPSRAYFSQNPRLNHAALNPLFNLMYSAMHQGASPDRYRFMTDDDAAAAIASLAPQPELATDSIPSMLRVERPDVIVVILESFSSHLMPSLGGEPVAIRLDSIARQGWLFDSIYACSFRTDRALPAIMSGFPGLPSTSLMKYVDKIEHVPSFPRRMKEAGWRSSYFYGGDVNFTNMLAYLVSQGFEHITADSDFVPSERRSKWGAHDDVLFRRALTTILADTVTLRPRLDVIQTSSSHEPFKVPFESKRFASEPRANAFAFTDSCLGAFVDSLRLSPRWVNTLMVIVPDHYGAYPVDLDIPAERHRIPLVVTGGALDAAPLRLSRIGSQNDIAATLLIALGLDAADFPFSKNLLDPSTPAYAIFSEPSLMGLVTPGAVTVINPDDECAAEGDSLHRAAAAMLQSVNRNFSEL